jgi:DNA-binding XRE family transcriptional regulator
MMESKDVLLDIRKKNHLSQDEMAERLMVTRQAVSRWENGETVPNTDTLKIISNKFDVSINTLLGSPRQLICQCCGMPLYEDSVISRETDGQFNEDYCKWCFTDGKFVYGTMEELLDFLVPHIASSQQMAEEDVLKMLKTQLPKLKHWNELA